MNISLSKVLTNSRYIINTTNIHKLLKDCRNINVNLTGTVMILLE